MEAELQTLSPSRWMGQISSAEIVSVGAPLKEFVSLDEEVNKLSVSLSGIFGRVVNGSA